MRIGIIGLGGLGSMFNQVLSRAGVGDLVHVDHDLIEKTNLNRVCGATTDDAEKRTPKVTVARRVSEAANPFVRVTSLQESVFTSRAIAALASCDLIVGCTDDSASRFALNEIACAYLRPYLDLATEIYVNEGSLREIGGRFTFLFPGDGCLLCARAIDPAEATAEFRPKAVRQAQARAGYVSGAELAAPQVMHLNGVVASCAAFEVHVWTSRIRRPERQCLFDLLKCAIHRVSFSRTEGCVTCGDLIGRGDLAGLGAKYDAWRSECA